MQQTEHEMEKSLPIVRSARNILEFHSLKESYKIVGYKTITKRKQKETIKTSRLQNTNQKASEEMILVSAQ